MQFGVFHRHRADLFGHQTGQTLMQTHSQIADTFRP